MATILKSCVLSYLYGKVFPPFISANFLSLLLKVYPIHPVSLPDFLLKNNSEGVYNAVAPETVSDQKLTKTIARILKKPLFMPNMPRFIMKLILGDMSELLFTNKNISSKKAINEGFKFKFPDIDSALEDILKKS